MSNADRNAVDNLPAEAEDDFPAEDPAAQEEPDFPAEYDSEEERERQNEIQRKKDQEEQIYVSQVQVIQILYVVTNG